MESNLQACYDQLDVAAEATLAEIEAAYRTMRELYDENALATYSLLDYAERQEKLEALQAAYDTIVQARLCPLPSSEPEPAAVPAATTVVDCDPHQAPGRYLQQHRERLGLSLHDVAERTKISRYHLRNIEAECGDKLPAAVYLRGFIREFARTVGVPDTELVVESFLNLDRPAESD